MVSGRVDGERFNSMTKYMVRMLKSSEYADWDSFVMQSPQGSIFALSDWLQCSSEKPVIYGCFRGSELVAGLPFVSRISKLGFRVGTHPLLTPYLGVLFKKNTGKYVSKISGEKETSRTIAKKLKEELSWDDRIIICLMQRR